jgi:SLBB domain-containing protein
MILNRFQFLGLLVVCFVTSCSSVPSGKREPTTIIRIPVPGDDLEGHTTWYRGYVVKTNSARAGGIIRVQIVGDVTRPGWLSVPQGTTVLEAIKEAGGFGEFALAKRIQVTDTAGKTTTLPLHRQKMSPQLPSRVWCGAGQGDYILQPNSRVYVPRH